jgi:hypothetical protein
MKTIQEVNKAIRKLEPNIKQKDPEFLIYQVLLSAAVVGPRQQPIIRFMKNRKWKEIVGIVKLAKRHEIFVGDKICGEIYENGVGLALGVGLILGYFTREKVEN